MKKLTIVYGNGTVNTGDHHNIDYEYGVFYKFFNEEISPKPAICDADIMIPFQV